MCIVIYWNALLNLFWLNPIFNFNLSMININNNGLTDQFLKQRESWYIMYIVYKYCLAEMSKRSGTVIKIGINWYRIKQNKVSQRQNFIVQTFYLSHYIHMCCGFTIILNTFLKSVADKAYIVCRRFIMTSFKNRKNLAKKVT